MKYRIPWFLVFLFLLLPDHAHAYLDPGTGSYFLQILAATLFSLLFLGQQWWNGLKGLLKRSSRKSEPPPAKQEQTE